MGADEVGTLATLKAHRAVTDPISEKNGGYIVGTAGDGLLLEFPSVVAAVTFAVETQGEMAERNAGIADDLRMLYRVCSAWKSLRCFATIRSRARANRAEPSNCRPIQADSGAFKPHNSL